MTDITQETTTSVVTPDGPETQAVTAPAPKGKSGKGFASAAPVLEKLFELYPHLFGQHFLPLKLGVFQDLLAAHPDDFKRDTLKVALGVHTRSTRYLQSVAAGNKRHDLAGEPVEDVAPEHIYLSIVELFRRRQGRGGPDMTPKLRGQLARAYEASGLSRPEYLALLPAPDEVLAGVLDQAIADVDQQRARQAALIRAFDASGQTEEAFADALGMDIAQLRTVLSQRQG